MCPQRGMTPADVENHLPRNNLDRLKRVKRANRYGIEAWRLAIMDTCQCELCIQYGCDCVETGKHDNCLCGECRPQREPTVDNYGS